MGKYLDIATFNGIKKKIEAREICFPTIHLIRTEHVAVVHHAAIRPQKQTAG
jgi:hypothetical protein